MISLGLRLAVSGGREAMVRLVIVAVAVGLGVGLLLTALSATSAVKVQNARHAWLWTGTASVPAGHAPAGTDPLWWGISGDEFGGQQIVRVDVAATGPTSPVPPGIPRDPAPGQYYASPALAEARPWFGRLGLDGLEGRRSGELSGGQAQRVALARGLVARPEVLFADEPTGSLDSMSGELVMRLLTAAVREQGTTVILVTHEARVAAYAGREVVVRDGTVGSLTEVAQ